jgi:hypothetical protein
MLRVAAIILLVATSVQSSTLLVPQAAQKSSAGTPAVQTNSTSNVTAVPGVDVVQGGDTGSSGAAAVALATSGGALGGLTTGNTTLRVEPASATFPRVATEVTSLRDAHSRVVANPDGTLTETSSSGRLNYRTGGGPWQAIDTTLTSSGETPGYNLVESSNNGKIVFNTTSPNEPLAAMIGAGFSLSVRVLGIAGVGARQGTTGLTYGTSKGDSSVRFDATSDGFEFGAVLNRAGAPSSYAFALDAHGLTLAVAPDGRTVMVLSGQGIDQKLVGAISAPTLYDARSVVAPASDVTVSLDDSASGLRTGETLLSYSIDAGWLASSGRAYPVTLDPSACVRWDATSNCAINVNGKATGYVDTFVSSAAPNQAGSGSVDYVGVDPTLGTTRSLYYFPHATLPDGAQVVSATFGVYMAGGTSNGQKVRASAITTTWSGGGGAGV